MIPVNGDEEDDEENRQHRVVVNDQMCIDMLCPVRTACERATDKKSAKYKTIGFGSSYAKSTARCPSGNRDLALTSAAGSPFVTIIVCCCHIVWWRAWSV